MALYLIHMPAGLHGALVDAASRAAAITAAHALCPDLNVPFANYTVVQIAAAAQGGFVNCLIEGDVIGATYAGPRRGR